jgi:ssDNA-binding replication factor A large subunit
MYMFSAKGKTLAQADLQNDSINKLKRLPAELSSFLEAKEKPTDSNRLGMTSEIGTLRYGLNGVSFKARIVQKSAVRAVTSKDGTPLLVCDVTLSDGTGEIPLAVWNNQIGTVATGDLIQIDNARVRSFRGKIQLSLSRKTGALTVLEHTRSWPISHEQPVLVRQEFR